MTRIQDIENAQYIAALSASDTADDLRRVAQAMQSRADKMKGLATTIESLIKEKDYASLRSLEPNVQRVMMDTFNTSDWVGYMNSALVDAQETRRSASRAVDLAIEEVREQLTTDA